ncbi:MAG: hypothetical protein ACE5H3_12875 [Planctomycetota bacterium]
MKTSPLLPLLLTPLLLLGMGACALPCRGRASGPRGKPEPERAGTAGQDSQEYQEEQAGELRDARRQLELERKKTARMRLQAVNEVRDAEAALGLARRGLAHFQEYERPHQLAQAELQRKTTADKVRETEEELAQLEEMYGEAELADKTAEIVLARTRRKLANARERLRLREEALADLRGHELAEKKKELELGLKDAEAGLQASRLALEILDLRRKAAEEEAEEALAELAGDEEDEEGEGR